MRTRRQQSSSDPMSLQSKEHRPVLLHESLELLDIQADDIVLDATLGGAGHAKVICERLGPKGTFIGIDADAAAIERAKRALSGVRVNVILEQGNFRHVESYLGKHVIPHIDKALFDLGWSGYQLSSGRGFSFSSRGGSSSGGLEDRLLMTYADTPGADAITADKIVNTWGEASIADILYGWGDERYSRRIAKAIIEHREKEPIRSSRTLADIIARAVPAMYRHGRTHPATKSFQALRIAVNDEIGALKEGISGAWQCVAPGGKIAVITFHSVEDREVKHLFRAWADEGKGTLLTKKPIGPSREEEKENPRSRSAKLRCIQKK